MSVERRFWTCDDIALLCAAVRNTKLSPDMSGLAMMLIFFMLSVGFQGLGWGFTVPQYDTLSKRETLAKKA